MAIIPRNRALRGHDTPESTSKARYVKNVVVRVVREVESAVGELVTSDDRSPGLGVRDRRGPEWASRAVDDERGVERALRELERERVGRALDHLPIDPVRALCDTAPAGQEVLVAGVDELSESVASGIAELLLPV